MKMKTNRHGFSLIEMLLVLVIVGVMIFMGLGYQQQQTQNLQIDRTSAQMQQILNAALVFYVNNGYWPTVDTNGNSMSCLQGTLSSEDPNCGVPYIPAALANSPYFSPYTAAPVTSTSGSGTATATSTNIFTVSVANLPSNAIALVVAGRLPLGVATGTTATASVNIPGLNLSDASAVNFAGTYHHGACVPAPSCPKTATGVQMEPQVFLVPVQVGGYHDPASTNVYPIGSFTAMTSFQYPQNQPYMCQGSTSGYVSGVTGTPDGPITPDGGNMAPCYDPAGTTDTHYWRVCLNVESSAGSASWSGASTGKDSWGQYVQILAFTRCRIPGEASGSGTNVYTN